MSNHYVLAMTSFAILLIIFLFNNNDPRDIISGMNLLELSNVLLACMGALVLLRFIFRKPKEHLISSVDHLIIGLGTFVILVSSQISTAVPLRCAAGLAAFSNCMGMYAPGVAATNSAAFLIAPVMPSAAGVSTNVAPYPASSLRRSTLMLSGMVSTSFMPLMAQISASPMPVLPLVGSTMRLPVVMRPSASAVSIMLAPMRSFTEPPGLHDSSLATMVADNPRDSEFKRTSGVPPMSSAKDCAMRIACSFDVASHCRWAEAWRVGKKLRRRSSQGAERSS